jgi:hypothetical protein
MADVVQRARTFTEDSVRPGSAWRAEALSLIIELADEVEKLANVIIDGAVAGYKREIETERTTTVNYYVRAYDPRTRIAAALYARAIERLGWNRSWDNLGAPSQQLWLDDADAVIRELKLEREHWQYGDGHTMGVRYRYVTEWEKEDE